MKKKVDKRKTDKKQKKESQEILQTQPSSETSPAPPTVIEPQKPEHSDPQSSPQMIDGKITAYKQYMKEPFLLAFRKTGTIYAALSFLREEMQMSLERSTILSWRKNDKKFREQFENADLEIFEKVEGTMLQRAVNGVPHFLYNNGEIVLKKDAQGNLILDADGKPQPVILWREYSDALQIFLAKTRGRGKYQEKIKHELDVKLISIVTKQIYDVCQRSIPQTCPNCKVILGIAPRMLRELQDVSIRLNQNIIGTGVGNG